MRTQLLILLLAGCPGDDAPIPSCGLELPVSAPTVPSCDDIEGRIAEVDIADWRDRFEGDEADSIFVSQQRCGDEADGSLAHPFCWIDDGIRAAEGLDHASVYLGPGEYSIMGELPCGQAQGHLPSIELIGAGANTTRLHVTCDLAEGKWSLQDLGLASDLMVVAPATELTLRRVIEQNLSGNGFLDVQGGLTVEDMILDLETPLAAESEQGEGDSLMGMPPLTGTTLETEVAMRLHEGAWGVGSGVCVRQATNGGILVTGAGTTLDLVDSVVTSTRSHSGTFNWAGYGIAVEQGAELIASGLHLEGNANANLLVHQATVSLEGSIVELSQSMGQYGGGVGVLAQGDASLTIVGSLLQGNDSPGAAASEGAVLSIADSTVQDNGFAGIVVLSAGLELSGSLVGDNVTDPSAGGGIAIFAHDLMEEHPVELDLVGNHIVDDTRGLYLRGHPDRTSGLIQDNRIDVTGCSVCPSLFATGTSEALQIGGNCFDGQMQLLLHGATASLEGNQYAFVEGGETIRQQGCDDTTEVDTSAEILPDPDNTAICPEWHIETSPLAAFLFAISEPSVEN